MDTIIILPINSESLKNIIRDSMREVLREQKTPAPMDPDEVYNMRQAAKFLDIAPQTLYGFTSNKKIPFYKRGKKLYFKKMELEKWLFKNKF